MRSGLSDRDLDTPGSPGCLPGLRPVLCRDDRFFAGFLPHGASVDGGREEFEESVPNCRFSSAIRLLCWATVASSSGQMAPCQVMAPVSGTRHQAGTGAELRHCRNSRRARAGVVQTAWPSFLDSYRPQPVTQVQPAGCTHLGRDDQASLVSEYESDIHRNGLADRGIGRYWAGRRGSEPVERQSSPEGVLAFDPRTPQSGPRPSRGAALRDPALDPFRLFLQDKS